jgi:hypothetical protein
MSRLTLIIPVALFLIVGSVSQSRADGWEVNNIWWNIIINYNNSGQTICLAEQYNNETFAAVTFDVYPAPNTRPPRHGTATQRNMQPYTPYRIFGWLDGTKPDPQCVLTGWQTLSGQRVKVKKGETRSSSRLRL